MSQAAVGLQPETPRMSEVRRLIAVFWEPGAAFADIARRPVCWAPLILIVLSALAFTYMASQRIGWEQIIREAVASNEQVQSMPAADRERLIATQAKFTGIAAYAGALVGTPVATAVFAGAIMLFFTVFMGATARFSQLFGVAAYAQLPGILSMIIGTVVMQLKSPEDFDIRNPTALNIGFYLPESVPKWLHSIGTSMDLIVFWIMALLIIGIRKVDPKASRSSAVISVVAPWAIYVTIKAGWNALMG